MAKNSLSFNNLVFKNDRPILKSSNIKDSKQDLELQSLRKRSLDEIEIPNFISDDEIESGKFFKQNFDLSQKNNFNDNDGEEDYECKANLKSKNYVMFDLKSRNLF